MCVYLSYPSYLYISVFARSCLTRGGLVTRQKITTNYLPLFSYFAPLQICSFVCVEIADEDGGWSKKRWLCVTISGVEGGLHFWGDPAFYYKKDKCGYKIKILTPSKPIDTHLYITSGNNFKSLFNFLNELLTVENFNF